MAYRLATDDALRRAVLAGQRRRLAAFAPAAVETSPPGVRGVAVSPDGRVSRWSSSATAPRSTGGSESLARAVAERLAVGLPRHGLHHLRPRLRHLAERAPRGERAGRRRGGAPLPGRGGAGPAIPSTASRSALWPPALGGGGASSGCSARAPTCPASWRPLEKRKDRLRGRLLLHLSLLPDLLGAQGGSRAVDPRPDGPRRAPLRFVDLPSRSSRPHAPSLSARPPEEELVRVPASTWRACRAPEVAGIGVETPPAPDVEGFRIRHEVAGPTSSTRAESTPARAAPRCSTSTRRIGGTVAERAELLLIGKLAMPTPSVARSPLPRVRVRGRKDGGHGGSAGRFSARAVTRASPSFSSRGSPSGTPGLVNARSPVLRDHAVRSRAPSTTRAPTSSSRPSTCSSARTGCARPSARTAAATSGPGLPLGRRDGQVRSLIAAVSSDRALELSGSP